MSRLNGLKNLAYIFSILLFVIRSQSSPFLTILFPLWFIMISLVFFYLYKVLFSGFLQFKSNFVDAKNNSKYRGAAPFEKYKLSIPSPNHPSMSFFLLLNVSLGFNLSEISARSFLILFFRLFLKN